MTNKYQIALEIITKYLPKNYGSYEGEQKAKLENENACLTLQELINNMKFIEEVQTPDYIRVQNLNEKLEFALDKSLDMYFRKGTYLLPSKEALKEYLLKEVQDGK